MEDASDWVLLERFARAGCETATAGTDGSPGTRIVDVAVQDDGRILICGYFEEVNGVECPHIARLNPDGSIDTTFRTPFLTLNQWKGLRRERQLRVARLAPADDSTTNRPSSSAAEAYLPEPVRIAAQDFHSDAVLIRYVGQPAQTYILQACETLVRPSWTNVDTNRADAPGAGELRDAGASHHSMRFYRLASP